MKLENNVKILDVNLHRSCYTKHGLHLNATGKERVIEMIINQLQMPKIENKENVIAQYWVENSEEYRHRIDKVRMEDKRLEQEETEEKKERDKESENQSDHDEAMKVHGNAINEVNTRNYREAERINLDKCEIGTNIMELTNKAGDVCVMNGNPQQNQTLDGKGSRQSTRSKKVSTLTNNDFLWEM